MPRPLASIRLLGTLLVAAATLLVCQDTSAVLIVGNCQLADAELASIIGGADECPDKDHKTCSSTEPEYCTDNNCTGDPYNPRLDCYDFCLDYHEYVLNLDRDDPDVISYCQGQCADLPDATVKRCTGALTTSKEVRKPNGYDDVMIVKNSNFETLDTAIDKCYRKCNCSNYCSLVGPPNMQFWACDTTATCSNTGQINVIDYQDPGECKSDES